MWTRIVTCHEKLAIQKTGHIWKLSSRYQVIKRNSKTWYIVKKRIVQKLSKNEFYKKCKKRIVQELSKNKLYKNLNTFQN